MRARSALALAFLLAAPLVLASMPRDDAPLASHAVAGALSVQLEVVLGRVAGPAASLPPGVMPAPESAPAVPPGGGAALQVHWLAGERSWVGWVFAGQGQAVDLDGDGVPELRVEIATSPGPALTISGLAPTRVAWAAWLEEQGARVGLTGAGTAPPAAMVALRDGDLRVQARGAANAWHAAFAFAGETKRTLAWLHEPGARGDLEAAVGLGYLVSAPAGVNGGLRLLLVDGERSHDLTVRDVPPAAQVAREEQGALRYRAPRSGGALAYSGDAEAVGQRGDLTFSAEPLPTALTVAPDGQGFAIEAAAPVDVLLDWQPPGAEGVRFVANGVTHVRAAPGGAGGLVLRGTGGQLAVLRPAGGEGSVVDLGAQGAAVSPASPLLPAAVALALGGAVAWAVRGPRGAKK